MKSPAVIPSYARRLPAGDRRQQILLAPIDIFAKRGFQGETTKEIAEAAGISEAIIFRHFATKQDLYAAILDFKTHEMEQHGWIEELRELALRNDDEEFFGLIVTKMLEAHQRDP